MGDIRHALRRLAATPILSLGAIVILALGIGCAVVMVDVLDRLLLRAPAGVTDPDRVARVYHRLGDSYMDRSGYALFESLTAVRGDLEAASTYFTESLSLGRGTSARRLEVVAHSGEYFAAVGVQPELGSFADVTGRSREDAAVISHALWQQEFGSSPDVLGKPLRLGVDTYTIVAVAPRGFRGIDWKPADVWLPLVRRARATYGADWKNSAFFLQTIVRLRPDVNRLRTDERVTAAYRAAADQPWKNAVLTLGDLRPARAPGARVGTSVEVLVAAMSIVVLLITCGNVANLLLVRGLRRDREFIVKTALGAGRTRLIREVLVEAALLSVGAGVCALFVVTAGGTLMRQVFLSPITALSSPIDTRVILVTVAFCIGATFLLGLAPALRLTTRRAVTPGHTALVRPSRVLDVFSGLQVALSLLMIIAAALFALSLWNARHQDFGMQTDHVAVMTTNLHEIGRPMENHAIHRQMQERLAKLPEVESLAMAESMPMQSRTSFFVTIPGRPQPTGPVTSDSLPGFNSVDPSFFSVMGMRLIDGRVFTEQENRKGGRSVAVITESTARAFWPGERAVGKCFQMKPDVCTEVVGVLRDARLMPSIRSTQEWASAIYLPIEQQSGVSFRALLVRTKGDPASTLERLRKEAQAAVPDAPYVDVHAFDDVFVAMLRPWRLGSIVFTVFGVLSLLVASAGLIAVGAYGVTRRTHEIGIRSALGAAPRQLVALVLSRSLLVVAAGLAAGIGLAWASSRMLNAQLFDVKATDVRVFIGAVCALLIVGTIAAWIPARRAARIDPVAALRAE